MRSRILLLASALVSTPALADHAGPTGVDAGGGINVLGYDTLDEEHAAAGFRLTYTRPDQRPDSVLEGLAGQHIHAHNTDYNLNASIGVAYGLNHHLTISAELPYVRRENLREGEHSHVGGAAVNEVVALGNVGGIGDLSLLAKYRLTDSDDGGFALIGGVKLPTGSTHQRDLDGERLETEHQPGTGSIDPLIGAAGGWRIGSLQLNASALYQFSGKGAQHSRLGDRAQGGVSLSHRFGPPPHHHDEEAGHHHNENEHVHEHSAPPGHSSWDAFAEVTGEWEGRQQVDGEAEQASGGKAVWFTPGARFNAASGYSIAAAIGVPVWQDIRASHPDNDYRLTLSLGRAF